jgi:hypothetical protein
MRLTPLLDLMLPLLPQNSKRYSEMHPKDILGQRN